MESSLNVFLSLMKLFCDPILRMEGGEVLCHLCACFVSKKLLDSEVGLGES